MWGARYKDFCSYPDGLVLINGRRFETPRGLQDEALRKHLEAVGTELQHIDLLGSMMRSTGVLCVFVRRRFVQLDLDAGGLDLRIGLVRFAPSQGDEDRVKAFSTDFYYAGRPYDRLRLEPIEDHWYWFELIE